MSFFPVTNCIPPTDPILGLASAFRKDPHPNRVNLAVGAYRDERGDPFVFTSVKEAEQKLLGKHKEYLPIEGDTGFTKAIQQLIFGTLPLHLSTFQTVGGTGALKIGAEYLLSGERRTLFLPSPSWPNHRKIFAEMRVAEYPYYHPKTERLDFSAMCYAIQKMPAGSVILLHGCCHNPTGVDLSVEQWREISSLIKKQHILPFFDLAYQGLGEGLEKDSYAPSLFAQQGHEFLLAYSTAKNFGLYGERVGCLAVVVENSDTIEILQRQIRAKIRAIWSSPPSHGARIVDSVLNSSRLKMRWLEELAHIRARISQMRKLLAEKLDAKSLLHQKGLFAYGLLSAEEVKKLQNLYAIYCPEDGRVNVAGLNLHNIDYVIDAVKAVKGMR